MDLTPAEQALKEAFIEARGYWRPWTEGLLRLSVGIEAYEDLRDDFAAGLERARRAVR